jgi:ABC-2 type transport system permease protein
VAFVIAGQARAILWAQWRSLANHYSGGRRAGFPFALLFAAVWYGLWVFLAWGVCVIAADPSEMPVLERTGPTALLMIFAYWQIVPIVMVSSGLNLDIPRLLVYPIPHRQLFGIEVLLRISTCLEMLLITSAATIGLSLNPRVPLWGPSALGAFSLFNLFVSAGVRDLLARLLARKRFREAMVVALVLLAGIPQVLAISGVPAGFFDLAKPLLGPWSPWGGSAALMIGRPNAIAAAALLAWTALAYVFGRSQFERGLRFDAAEILSRERGRHRGPARIERLLALLSAVFPDPFAALVEKEVRVLSRSPRFRLLFLMGFSFGLLIWLPLAMRGDDDSVVRTNYLSIVSAYALMLMGEVCFWNSFGMDRGAAQTYFVMPLKLETVLAAKNTAACLFILLELLLITLVCALLRMPISAQQIGEAFGVTAVLTVFLLAVGNMISTRYPRPVDPAQSWRASSMGRVQAYLLFLYPLASAPVFLAYGARYAFDSEAALYIVLFVDLLIGLAVYSIAMESAAATARQRKEHLIAALSTSHGPIGT